MQNQPLAEVFGHLPTDFSPKAIRYRRNRCCPFNNEIPGCTQVNLTDPFGVCSIYHREGTVITCPIRLRENWLVVSDAADFFFPKGTDWTSLTEVRLVDSDGRSAGNIDVVLVAYDCDGRVYDFGSIEIQAVDISGNVRESFTHYMSDWKANASMNWTNQPSYPRPDFLSSSRKSLAPQLIFKGSILHTWNKKMAVALDSTFFRTLPDLQEVQKEDANIAWLVYDLIPNLPNSRYTLRKTKTVYTRSVDVLKRRTRPTAGSVNDFLKTLQAKVDDNIEFPP